MLKSHGNLRLAARTVVSSMLFAVLLAFSLGGRSLSTAGAQTEPISITGNGLHTVVFDSPSARVTVKLPDEIRTGDTISGTLVQEPKGATEDERAKNKAAVRSRVIRLLLTRIRKPDEPPKGTEDSKPVTLTVPLSGGDSPTVQTTSEQGNTSRIEFKAVAPGAGPAGAGSSEGELGSAVVPLDADPAPVRPRPRRPTLRPHPNFPSLRSGRTDDRLWLQGRLTAKAQTRTPNRLPRQSPLSRPRHASLRSTCRL